MSVGHISRELLPRALQATRVPFVNRGRKIDPPSIDDVTVAHMVAAVVEPFCHDRMCSRDGGRGCAYIDAVAEDGHAAPSTALISYSWSNVLSDVATSLDEWATSHGRDPADTYVWMCALCLNQLRLVQTLSPAALAAEFGPRVTAIGRILPLLVPWEAPVYVTRAWCLFELFTAIRHRRDVEIEMILPSSQRAAFVEAMKSGNYALLEAELDGIRAEDAIATKAVDLSAIRDYINELPGGFPALNETVRGCLRRWFEGQGGECICLSPPVLLTGL